MQVEACSGVNFEINIKHQILVLMVHRKVKCDYTDRVNTVNLRYNGRMGGREDRVSVIADVHNNRVRGYSRQYTIGYISSRRNKNRNT
jgi:hypothetical protein